MTQQETGARPATEILSLALDWLRAGRRIALATVVETSGSSPRPVGSNLVVDADGNFEGSVSGGCVESAVVAAAQDVIAIGAPALMDFGYSDADAWQVGLACGGKIRIYLERIE